MTGTPLTALNWRKSSRSGPRDVCCVEIAFAGATTAVRDSKNPDSAALLFGEEGWRRFLLAAKKGEFGPS